MNRIACAFAFALIAMPAIAAEPDRLLEGFRRYHAVCSHCHGPDGLGSSFGPSLIENRYTEEAFRAIVLDGVQNSVTGRASVMPAYAKNTEVVRHLDALFDYLDARASGALARGRPRSSTMAAQLANER